MPVQTASKSSTKTKSKFAKLSDNEIFAHEKITVQHDPFFLVEGKFLSIKTKDNQLIRLPLNQTQQIINNKIKELRKQGKPVRMWILKARQEGVSTDIEGIVYAFTSQTENLNSLIIADDKEHASNLFDMSKLYQSQLEKDEPHLAPRLKKSNEKKLEFDEIHSQIIIATADNTAAPRSHTFSIVHLSECAYFRDLDDVMDGLNQSVPDNASTMIIGESTANGMDAFYDEWMRAINGQSDWVPNFIPWFWMDEYRLPLVNGKMHSIDGISFSSEYSREQFLTDERKLQDEHKLDDEQINWRRYAIVNKVKGKITTFKQEYPATWQEAFQVSGVNYFDRSGMDRQTGVEPLASGEIFEIEMKYEFRKMDIGRIFIYEYPKVGEQYIVAMDASEGLGIDEASALVLNKRSNETVAEVAGQYTPEELAHMGIMLSNYFNKGLAVPENKGYGYMLCKLVAAKYGNIYYKRDKLGEVTKEYGFNTNSVTRPQYLAQMNEEIRLGSTQLKSKKLIGQCKTFVIDPKTLKAEAALNKQDGLVICRGIAGQVRTEYPFKSEVSQTSIETKRKELVHERKVKRHNAGIKYGKK